MGDNKGVEELREEVIDLKRRIELLETQFDDIRIEAEEEKKGQRYYAVLRGKFDPTVNDFVSGVFGSIEEYDEAVKGATRAKAKSKSTHEKAAQYYEDNIEAVEIENTTFRNPQGLYSPQWYLVYPSTGSNQDYFIVPDYEEAYRYVKGSCLYSLKRCSTYRDAQNLMEQKKTNNNT